MFAVIYSFRRCKVIADYANYDTIRGQKVTCKSVKWKSTNFELRQLPQPHSLWTFCILKLFSHSACYNNQKRKPINYLFLCGWYGVPVLFKLNNTSHCRWNHFVNIAVILSLTIFCVFNCGVQNTGLAKKNDAIKSTLHFREYNISSNTFSRISRKLHKLIITIFGHIKAIVYWTCL